MTFFESLLVLLLAAIILLQLARRLGLPYPAMLAGAGVLLAFLPKAPNITIEPDTALALFIAPVILDAAYDFPIGAALRFLSPLIALAFFAVVVTTAVVAALGHRLLGLPISAAIALGAIVAPPDAAAATAVLSSVKIPRSAEEVLLGESLFNDATTLLLYSGALTVFAEGSLTLPHVLRLSAAAPGGILLGIVWALLFRHLNRFFQDTLGGNLLQFVNTYLVWLVAEHLHLSAVLCTIAFAMTAARSEEALGFPRMRVQSYAVWSAVVFTLNVLAFMLMGMQARNIVHHMQTLPLDKALQFSGMVVLTVIVVRLVIVLAFNRGTALLRKRRGGPEAPRLRQAFLVGWSGMRGFVTLATAFALPEDFPQRDTVVLTAFSVVLGTLVLQGLTLGPLIRLLKLDKGDGRVREVINARSALATAGLSALEGQPGPIAENLRFSYSLDLASSQIVEDTKEIQRRRKLGLAAIAAERKTLEDLRANDSIGIADYGMLQEEIDWRELTLLRDEERRIEEV